MFPSSSQKVATEEKPFGVSTVFISTRHHWPLPSGPVILYSHKPPVLKSMLLVTAFQGFGAHHLSNSSGWVHACHTFSIDALNERVMFNFLLGRSFLISVVFIMICFIGHLINCLTG